MGGAMLAMAAFAQSFSYTAADFTIPPMQWRPVPLWFWNNTAVNAQEIEQQLEGQTIMADAPYCPLGVVSSLVICRRIILSFMEKR